MAIPRKKLVDDKLACCYHITSRSVRGMHLCGWDRLTRKQYGYRRRWLVKRMRALAQSFAVELYAYAVMSNHFHTIVYYDPLASAEWSDEEVARRWVAAFPPAAPNRARRGRLAAQRCLERRKEKKREELLADLDRLARARRELGSLSAYMKHLKQPFARQANLEDGCKGHFFEQRFYSGALLSEKAILAAMAYVDLNPVRAEIVRRLEDYQDASIHERLMENSADALTAYLLPLASGLAVRDPHQPRVAMVLGDYIEVLEGIVAAETGPSTISDNVARWRARVSSLRRPQRAFGSEEMLRAWTASRGLRLKEAPLPD